MSTETNKAKSDRGLLGTLLSLFDIRNVIGALLAVYGIILLLMGLFADAEVEKTGGPNANLWAGIVLLVIGAVFIAWGVLRPVVPDAPGNHEEE
jgi:drug/metabolite transporter (DMT)-like permease